MRDIATKVDSSSTLNASEFNSFIVELENLVTRAGITLDAAAGPDNNLFMLARSVLIHTQAGMSYQDNGAANTFVLTPVQALFEQPTAYVDGMTVRFKAAATNTGACTINVDGLGAITLAKAGGAAYAAGEIVAGNIITANYFSGNNRFEEVSNTTPEASGPAAPDQVAVYADSGSATQITLTIEPGYNQPSAFTDQMVVLFKLNVTNDGVGNHPINVSGLGVKDLVEKDGSDPIAGRLTADDWVMAVFREVRDEFEIAFVYEQPQPDVAIPATVSSSSGTVFNLDSLTESRAPTGYVDGMVVTFRAPQTNTGSVDINLDGLGLKDLRNLNGANFTSGQVPSGAMVVAQFVGSEDRFRASVTILPEPNLTEARSARCVNLTTSSLAPAASLTNFLWSDPEFDDLGFFDPVTRNWEIPSGLGIERVDVILHFNLDVAGSGDDFTVELRLNGVRIGAQNTRGANTRNGITIALNDIPVSDGDVFSNVYQTQDVGSSIAIESSYTIRVSKFAAS